MKVGDLVHHSADAQMAGDDISVGIIIEVIDHVEVPPAVKILWQDDSIDKEWTDDIEVISESR